MNTTDLMQLLHPLKIFWFRSRSWSKSSTGPQWRWLNPSILFCGINMFKPANQNAINVANESDSNIGLVSNVRPSVGILYTMSRNFTLWIPLERPKTSTKLDDIVSRDGIRDYKKALTLKIFADTVWEFLWQNAKKLTNLKTAADFPVVR